MLGFLKRFFTKKPALPADPEEIVEEFWLTDFSRAKTARFLPETQDSYTVQITPRGLHLHLHRKNLFAWTENPVYRYRDFVLEALIDFSDLKEDREAASAGTSAAGILFRLISDSTFYSAQISDRGFVRLDAVTNGTPIPILGWTETARNPERTDEDTAERSPYENSASVYSLRIIARDTSITLIVNDTWVAQCTDDTIQAAGKIAFAGQTWEKGRNADFTLSAISVDSRPIEVETMYTRWNQYLPIPEQAHIRLAETWYAMGRYLPALYELQKLWKKREATYSELLLAGQIHLEQRLYAESEECFLKARSLSPEKTDAIAELAGLYYLQNNWKNLEKHLSELPRDVIETSSFLSNLEGHLFSWKGQHALSAQAYSRAGNLNSEQGLFFLNAGIEWNSAGEESAAKEALIQAARLFLSTDAYDDLERAISLLQKIDPDNKEIPPLYGKYWYAAGDIDKAYEYLSKAVKHKSKDSAVWYLYGMILLSTDGTDKAVKALEKAVSLEPEFGLYRFRLAEIRFNSGMDYLDQLHDALEKDPDNGWVYNLAALHYLKANDLDEAKKQVLRARELLPHELRILVNFAEIERRRGNLDEVLPLLSGEDPDTLHATANLLVEDGRFDEADDWYRQALRRKPSDPEILTDCAANCLERDLISEADDLLARAIDYSNDERIYQLIGILAGKKGEYPRAEIALLQGLELHPESTLLMYELSGVYITTGKFDKAQSLVKRIKKAGDAAQAEKLAREIQEAGTNRIVCSSCRREWRVPKNIPPQGSLRLHAQPPDDLPAGTCPTCRETYCIGCARENLGEDGRFRCKTCNEPLKLIDQNVLWILTRWHQEVCGENKVEI